MSASLFFPIRFLMPSDGDLLVDLGVVNDLAEDEEPAVLEDLARRVGEIDRALDAVAKAELLREPHRDVADVRDAARSRAASRRCRCGNAIPPAACTAAITSGVRRFTFSRAVVPLEIRFVLMPWEGNYHSPAVLQWPTSRKNFCESKNTAYWSTSRGPGGSLNQLEDINSERGGSGSRL